MVTKATVKKKLSDEEVRVYIPMYEGVEEEDGEKDLSNTQTARIISVSGIIPDLYEGDTVYVCIEDNNLGDPIVMGKLLLDGCTEKTVGTSRATFSKLVVKNEATLCSNTSIGDVTSKNISYLKGVRSNIQNQFDTIVSQRDKLFETLSTKFTTFADNLDSVITGG